MTEKEPPRKKHRPSYNPKPTEVDRELFHMEEGVLQRYKDGYYNLLNAYGFLNKIFFAGKDGMAVEVPIKISGKEYGVDAEEFFQATIPTMLGEIAQRLTDMGEGDYVRGVNEIVREDWLEP